MPRMRVRSAERVFLHRALGCACARKVARHIQPLGNQCFSQPLQVHCLNQEGVPPVFNAFTQFVVAVRASSRVRCLLTLVNLLGLHLVVLVVGQLLFVGRCEIGPVSVRWQATVVKMKISMYWASNPLLGLLLLLPSKGRFGSVPNCAPAVNPSSSSFLLCVCGSCIGA